MTNGPEAARNDARRARRRWRWIAGLSLPGFVALVTFALMAWLPVGASEWWLVVTLPVGVAGVFCWGVAPILSVLAIVLFLRDPWRRLRPRHERTRLGLLVFGSPIAWFLSNGINDTYHLLR